MRRIALSLLYAVAATALCASETTPRPATGARESGERGAPGLRRVHNDVAGVSLDVPANWRVHEDPVLFNTYGFALFDPAGPKAGGHERSPVARIALAYQIAPTDVERLVDDLLRKNHALPVQRIEVELDGGSRAVGVTGLPGTDPYTLLYVAAGNRVYRIGLWTPEPGLNQRSLELLASLRFEAPARSIESLALTPVEEAMRARPSGEDMARNAQAHAERVAAVQQEGGEPSIMHSATAATPVANAACEFGQPSGLFWQTVWDSTNYFYSGYTTRYSGTYYNLRPGDYGWSAMSGNYGSWWGQNYHRYKCYSDRLNQYYANDWPVHYNGNVYPATVGTVEWAGWDYYDSEGYYTLGNYVVVRNGSYRAIMAHLTSIASGISWGASVGMNTIIGYAGKTGGPWDEHVHSRIAYGESLTYNGQPYGGSTVWPTSLRCVSCRATDSGDTNGNGDGQWDYKDSNGAKYYRRFYHGRWMRG
jgi:hypothetical protein